MPCDFDYILFYRYSTHTLIELFLVYSIFTQYFNFYMWVSTVGLLRLCSLSKSFGKLINMVVGIEIKIKINQNQNQNQNQLKIFREVLIFSVLSHSVLNSANPKSIKVTLPSNTKIFCNLNSG